MKGIGDNLKLIIGLIILCVVLSFSSVSATVIDDNVTANQTEDIVGINEVDEVPDEPDLVFNDTIYIDSENFYDYFEDGVLKSKCSDKTLIFTQNFENLGKLTIDANNVTIKGNDFYLKNTVFEIISDRVTLSNVNLELDSEFADNDGAGIEVVSDYVNLINVNINYVVPTNVEAYGIYAMGYENRPLKNLRIINSYINFEGHNNDLNVYNCALKLSDCKDAIIENNTIESALPLKDIIFGADGAELASDLVLTVGIGGCDNISFVGNSLISEVNKRTDCRYPSLDCMLVTKSDNCLIYNNSIYMTDFLTYLGTDNYIYGLDIYNLNNLTASKNKITIITTGGKLAAGTAYPMQLTGPLSNVNITENDLYSFSNGPNIGIYSQNFYGTTKISITNNKINVTGLAGTHEWALVAGIESQDSNSNIVNNSIEVHSVSDVSIDDNIYGVSYRQSTSGDHQYNIQNNTVFSDGFYSVSILSSKDSVIGDNLLISYNPDAKNGNNGYKYWDINSHENLEFYNNRVITAFDYFAQQNNNIDNGDDVDYTSPTNTKGISNKIDGSNIQAEKTNKFNYNPLIPGSSDTVNGKPEDGNQQNSQTGDDSNQQSGGSDNKGTGSGNSSNGAMSLREALMNFMNSNTDGGNTNTTSYNGQNANTVSNNTDSNPSDAGEDSSQSESKTTQSFEPSAAGESSGVSKKVYEIEEKNEIDRFIPGVFFVIPVLILLFIGTRRRKSQFD